MLDSTAPNLDEHRSTVLQVLQQIGVPDEKIKNMIEVWNKVITGFLCALVNFIKCVLAVLCFEFSKLFIIGGLHGN